MFTSGTCDYLTITAKHRTQEYAALGAVFDAIKLDDDMKGVDEKPARALGYVGTKCGTMFLGSNHDGGMFRASGYMADVAARMFSWVGGEHHVTRVDFQLTWGYERDYPNLAEIISEGVRAAQKVEALKVPPQVRLISSYGKGDTVTIGARSSEVFVRIYDKSREAKVDGPPWNWRYEVELKGERALQAIRLYRLSKQPDDAVFNIVDYWMKERLVDIPWGTRPHTPWPEIGRPETDAERKLKWLENHVKSSVTYLVMKGHRNLVLEALGLDTE